MLSSVTFVYPEPNHQKYLQAVESISSYGNCLNYPYLFRVQSAQPYTMEPLSILTFSAFWYRLLIFHAIDRKSSNPYILWLRITYPGHLAT